MVAAPYAEEVWTGIEYMSASHLIMHGLVEEGLDIVRAARDRHDGSRRNPWNDIECGSYYARSMSAWQLVNAWSGLHADFVDGTHRASLRRPRATTGCSGRRAPLWATLTRIGDGDQRSSVLGGTLAVHRQFMVDGQRSIGATALVEAGGSAGAA